MFSSTLQVLENYRDTIYATNDMPDYDPFEAPAVPPMPEQHKLSQRLPTSKFAVQPNSTTYASSLESTSASSSRSNSLSFGSSGGSTFSDVSTKSSHREEIRKRRTPSGSRTRVADLKLIKSNGSTQLEPTELPRYKILSRYVDGVLVEDPKPAIPKKNPMRNSMQRKARTYDDMQPPAWAQQLREEISEPSKQERRPLKLDIPANDRVVAPPSFESMEQKESHSTQGPCKDARRPGDVHKPERKTVKKPAIGLPARPDTGKRLPALPKEAEEDTKTASPATRRRHSLMVRGRSSPALNVIAKAMQGPQELLQNTAGPTMADVMAGIQSEAAYNQAFAPNAVSPSGQLSSKFSQKPRLRRTTSTDSALTPNTTTKSPFSPAEQLVSRFNPQRILSPELVQDRRMTFDPKVPLRYPSYSQKNENAFSWRKATNEAEVSPGSQPHRRNYSGEEVSPRSGPAQHRQQVSIDEHLSPFSKQAPIVFGNSWTTESPMDMSRSPIVPLRSQNKIPQDHLDARRRETSSPPPPPPPKTMLPSNPKPKKNTPAPQPTRRPEMPPAERSEIFVKAGGAAAFTAPRAAPTAPRELTSEPRFAPNTRAPFGAGVGLPAGPRGHHATPAEIVPATETTPRVNTPKAPTPVEATHFAVPQIDDTFLNDLAPPKPAFGKEDRPVSVRSVTSDYDTWTPGPSSPVRSDMPLPTKSVYGDIDPYHQTEPEPMPALPLRSQYPTRTTSRRYDSSDVVKALTSPRPSSSISNMLPNNPYRYAPSRANGLTPPPEASNTTLEQAAEQSPVQVSLQQLNREPSPPLSPVPASDLNIGNFTCYIGHRPLTEVPNTHAPVRCQTCAVNAKLLHTCPSCNLTICGHCKQRLGQSRGDLGAVVRQTAGEKEANAHRREAVDAEPETIAPLQPNVQKAPAYNPYAGTSSYAPNNNSSNNNNNLTVSSTRQRAGTNETARSNNSGFPNSNGEIRGAPPMQNSRSQRRMSNQGPPPANMQPPPRMGPDGGYGSTMSSPYGRAPPVPWMSSGPGSARSQSPGAGMRGPPPQPWMQSGPGSARSNSPGPYGGPTGAPYGRPGGYGAMPPPPQPMNLTMGGGPGGMPGPRIQQPWMSNQNGRQSPVDRPAMGQPQMNSGFLRGPRGPSRSSPIDRDADDGGLDLDDINASGLYADLGADKFGGRARGLPGQAFMQPKIGPGAKTDGRTGTMRSNGSAPSTRMGGYGGMRMGTGGMNGMPMGQSGLGGVGGSAMDAGMAAR
jgi:hypothetical protein